jgi:hypothetical protein
LDKLENFQNEIRNNRRDYEELILLVDKIEGCEYQLKEFSKIEKAEEEVDKALEIEDEIKNQEQEINILKILVNEILSLEKCHDRILEEIIIDERKFEKLMPEGSICLLCGGVVK